MLLAYNFDRLVINPVQAEIDDQGSDAESAALRREFRLHLHAGVSG